MNTTALDIQAAVISYLKASPTITSQMTGISGTEIRETQWQGSDFVYPALRVYVDFMPSINGCGVDSAHICIEVHAEEKSSLMTKVLSGISRRACGNSNSTSR